MRNNLRLIRRALNGNEAAADELGEEIDIGESLCCEIEQLREENKQLRQGDPPAELELPKRIPHAEAYIAGTVEGVPEMYRFRGGQWEACMLLDVLATESHDFQRENKRLREAMTAVASMPGKEWLACQLALGEALQGGGDNLDYVFALAAEAKEVSDADECQHEWIPRSDYGFDICRKCHVPRVAAKAKVKP